MPVQPTNHPPVITSTPVTQVNEGQSYSYNVDAADADGNTLTYSLTQGPNWLSINSQNGLITGTAPSVSSNTEFNVAVRVSDGTESVTQSYVLKVINKRSSSSGSDDDNKETRTFPYYDYDYSFTSSKNVNRAPIVASDEPAEETISTDNKWGLLGKIWIWLFALVIILVIFVSVLLLRRI